MLILSWAKNFLINIPLLILIFVFLFSPLALSQDQRDNETIEKLLDRIKTTIEKEPPDNAAHRDRIDFWKHNVYETQVLLDKLLDETKKFRAQNEGQTFTHRNPFISISAKKSGSLRLIVQYRKFLYDSLKEAQNAKESGDFFSLKSDLGNKAQQFSKNADSDEYSDLRKVFDIREQSRRLEEQIEKCNSVSELEEIMNGAILATHDAFIELRTIVEDLKNIYRQFTRIRKYYEGNASVPPHINPTAIAENQPKASPSVEYHPTITLESPRTENPSPMPTRSVSQHPTSSHRPSMNILSSPSPSRDIMLTQSSYDFVFSSGYPFVGQTLYLVLLKATNDSNINSCSWLMNGKVFASGNKAAYKFKKAGNYRLDLVITDKKGRKISKSRLFQVAEKDLSFTYGWSPEQPEPGQKVHYFIKELTGGKHPYKIRWSLNGSLIGEGKLGEFELPKSAENVLSVAVEDARGQIKTGSSVISADVEPLDYQFWWTQSDPVVGQTTRFGIRNLRGGSPPYFIKWKMNGEFIGEGDKIKYTFTKPGENQLEVEVADSKGRLLIGTKKFIVLTKPK